VSRLPRTRIRRWTLVLHAVFSSCLRLVRTLYSCTYTHDAAGCEGGGGKDGREKMMKLGGGDCGSLGMLCVGGARVIGTKRADRSCASRI
jgi:hypothetical protein